MIDLARRTQRYIEEGCEELELSLTVRSLAAELFRTASSENLHIKNAPRTSAGGAVYLAALLEDERRSQSEVAKAMDTTEASVRNKYQEIGDTLELDLSFGTFASCPYCSKRCQGPPGMHTHIRQMHPKEYSRLVEKYDYRPLLWRKKGDMTFTEILEVEFDTDTGGTKNGK